MKTATVLLSLFWAFQIANAQSECKRQPLFINKFGFDPTRAAISTSERHIMGVALIELDLKTGQRGKIHQQPSWRDAGYMSGIAIDELGNVYAIPAPTVNILYNKPEEQNWVYKIDAQSGEMKRFVELPAAASPTVQNPYGTLGIFYDCDTRTLFVSSVLGSTQSTEKGRIFAVELSTQKISIVAENIDIMGIGIAKIGNKRLLMMGKTRSSDIYSLELDANNKPISKPNFAFTLDDLGPRGDDRARKIRYINNNLQINATSFYYNLTAPTEKPETAYTFTYNPAQQKWQLLRYE